MDPEHLVIEITSSVSTKTYISTKFFSSVNQSLINYLSNFISKPDLKDEYENLDDLCSRIIIFKMFQNRKTLVILTNDYWLIYASYKEGIKKFLLDKIVLNDLIIYDMALLSSHIIFGCI